MLFIVFFMLHKFGEAIPKRKIYFSYFVGIMQIRLSEGDKSAFYIEENGQRLAEMSFYVPVPGKMIIDHTEVAESLKGKGVARSLLDATVAYAREKHLKILPVCPYAHAVMLRHKEEFADVLAS